MLIYGQWANSLSIFTRYAVLMLLPCTLYFPPPGDVMNTNHLRHTSMMIAVGFLAAAQAVPLDKPGATVIKDASLAKAFAQATRQFTPQGSGFTAKNPSQPYSTTISTTGQMKLKVGQSQVGISASAYGFGAQRMPISAPTLSSGKDKDGWPEVQLQRTGLSERYVNEGRGMHHWLSVDTRPSTANGNLWVNLSVTGAKGFRSLSQTAAEVTIGATKLKYTGLKVWDAAGRTLPARMETNSTGIGLVVTDANAKYPITIDPVWSSETKLQPGGSNEDAGGLLAIKGNLAVIGSWAYTTYMFRKGNDGWVSDGTITNTGNYSVATDGERVAMAVYNPNGVGYVAIYEKHPSMGWQVATTISDSSWGESPQSIAMDTKNIVIGIPYTNNFRGECWVYRIDGSQPGLGQELVDTTLNNIVTPFFGKSVAISGDSIVVGAPGSWSDYFGSASVFRYSDNTNSWHKDSTLTDSNGFGHSVAMTDTDLFIGHYSYSGNSVHSVFAYPDHKVNGYSNPQIITTPPDSIASNYTFGISVAANSRYLFVGSHYNDSDLLGSVSAFEKTPNGWTFVEAWRPDSLVPYYGYAMFGFSLAATESDLIVGAPYDSGNGSASGSAYVYALGAGGSGGTSNPTVTVTFPSLLSYGGTPGIYGSLSGKGLVTLSSPAPAGGTTLDLNSTSGHLTVPATVTVAAGETTAEFTFATEYVNSDSDGLVQASGTGVTGGDCTVKVLANKVAKISGVTLNNRGTGTGTVKLAVPAASDYTVYLASENPNLLYVPDSVTVPAGSLSAQFQAISNNPVSQLTEVYVSASPANSVKRAKFTIRPEVQISSVQLNDSVILAGTQTIGTVILEGAAPAGGQVVALSSNRSTVSVPASVTIPEGMMSAEFSILSTGSAATSATITAKNSNGVKKTAKINVVRPTLTSISLSASTVTGGKENPTFTVTLASAMTMDITISLSSNNGPLAHVPATIMIPAGQLSETGTVITGRWSGANGKAVKITARYKLDSAKTVTLTVTK